MLVASMLLEPGVRVLEPAPAIACIWFCRLTGVYESAGRDSTRASVSYSQRSSTSRVPREGLLDGGCTLTIGRSLRSGRVPIRLGLASPLPHQVAVTTSSLCPPASGQGWQRSRRTAQSTKRRWARLSSITFVCLVPVFGLLFPEAAYEGDRTLRRFAVPALPAAFSCCISRDGSTGAFAAQQWGVQTTRLVAEAWPVTPVGRRA